VVTHSAETAVDAEAAEPHDHPVAGIGYTIKETQGGNGLIVGRPGDSFVVEQMQDVAVDLLIAELLRGLLEVACQLADVVDVNLDGLGRAVA